MQWWKWCSPTFLGHNMNVNSFIRHKSMWVAILIASLLVLCYLNACFLLFSFALFFWVNYLASHDHCCLSRVLIILHCSYLHTQIRICRLHDDFVCRQIQICNGLLYLFPMLAPPLLFSALHVICVWKIETSDVHIVQGWCFPFDTTTFVQHCIC